MTRRATSGLLVLLLLTACRQEAAPPPVPPPPRADELQAELTSPRPTPFVLPGGYRAPAVTAALPDYPLRHDYAALARAARLPDLTVA
ncbi:MAG: hypothetical protein HUU35_15725, partial [Armatimonadetes bacterium]|nr:hypothetical protein [Armatimonadota bacterium]